MKYLSSGYVALYTDTYYSHTAIGMIDDVWAVGREVMVVMGKGLPAEHYRQADHERENSPEYLLNIVSNAHCELYRSMAIVSFSLIMSVVLTL